MLLSLPVSHIDQSAPSCAVSTHGVAQPVILNTSLKKVEGGKKVLFSSNDSCLLESRVMPVLPSAFLLPNGAFCQD